MWWEGLTVSSSIADVRTVQQEDSSDGASKGMFYVSHKVQAMR